MNKKYWQVTLDFFSLTQIFIFVFQRLLYARVFPEIGKCTDTRFIFSTEIPYKLLIINVVAVIIIKLYYLLRAKDYKMGIFQIIVIFILAASLLFRTPFEYLAEDCDKYNNCTYTTRYDKMLTKTSVNSDEGDMCDVPFLGRYLYIPFNNKLISIDGIKITIEDVKPGKGDIYYINNEKYKKEASWFVES